MRTKVLMALVAVFFLVSPAFADVVYNFDTPFAGATPSGQTPWLVATFTQAADNQVTLTLATPGLLGSEFVSGWFFNYNGSNPISIAQIGPVTAGATAARYSQDHYTAGTDGAFDILISFPTSASGRFTGGLTESFAITGAGVRESMFHTLSTGGTWPDGFAAAYLQSVGPTGGIGLVTDTPTTAPEPSMMLLLGFGLVGVVGFRRSVKK